MIVHRLPDKQCTVRTNPNQEFCYRYDSTDNLIINIVQVIRRYNEETKFPVTPSFVLTHSSDSI